MKWMIILAILVLSIYNVTGQIVPPPQDMVTDAPTPQEIRITQQIKNEAQNTRKFMIDTYNEKSELFFKEADSRMAYMEQKLDSTLDAAIVSLSVIFAGVTLFILSLYAFFARLMERARYKKLEKAITENINREMNRKVDVQKDGYVTIRNYSQEDKQAEMIRIQEQKRQEILKQQEQQWKREIAMLQAKIAQIKMGEIPKPPAQPIQQNDYSMRYA